jgi:hypothetical protein
VKDFVWIPNVRVPQETTVYNVDMWDESKYLMAQLDNTL